MFKKFLIVLLVVTLGIGAFLLLNKKAEPVPVVVKDNVEKKIIGTSVEERQIESFTYGSGAEHLLFVGGMHGGYEWNSVALAYQLMDYLKSNPNTIPAGVSVTIIPALNPDGLYKVTGKVGRFKAEDASTSTATLASGRFNANKVDLNRNFDCKWNPKATWQSKTVSAGTKAFSEPEAKALRDFVSEIRPVAVVFWHSQANAIYASECKTGILPVTLDIMNAYSKASGYKAVKSFDSYEITGDAEGWLASLNIPAITVELKTHTTTEWPQNLAGIKALFEYYR